MSIDIDKNETPDLGDEVRPNIIAGEKLLMTIQDRDGMLLTEG